MEGSGGGGLDGAGLMFVSSCCFSGIAGRLQEFCQKRKAFP